MSGRKGWYIQGFVEKTRDKQVKLKTYAQIKRVTLDLKEVTWVGMECTDLVHDWDEKQAVVNMVLNLA